MKTFLEKAKVLKEGYYIFTNNIINNINDKNQVRND